MWLEDKGHNKGGVHAHFRVLRSFLYWYELENDFINWANPIQKVKVKRPRQEPLEPADIKAVKAMLDICKNDFTGVRDRLILLILLDTELRASELLALDFININPIVGTFVLGPICLVGGLINRGKLELKCQSCNHKWISKKG